MDNNFTKIPENAESRASDREKEDYPVQQVAVTYPIGEKEVKDAVKELNPDTDSLLTSSLIILSFYILLINSYLYICATQKRVAQNVF